MKKSLELSRQTRLLDVVSPHLGLITALTQYASRYIQHLLLALVLKKIIGKIIIERETFRSQCDQ